jgi:hypothetical protein
MEILQLLCSRCYCPANIPQLKSCSNWLTLRLAAISHQHPTLLFTDWLTTDYSSSRILCYDQRSVSQSVLKYSTHLGLMTRFLLLSDNCGLVDMGHSLWWEDAHVVYNCCWSSPAQSFSGPSPVGLATIIYCLRFENSLFVASYDSQGYGGGIRPHLYLHTGLTTARLVSSLNNPLAQTA